MACLYDSAAVLLTVLALRETALCASAMLEALLNATWEAMHG